MESCNGEVVLSWTTIFSLTLALVTVAIAFGVVMSARPAARRLQGISFEKRLPPWLGNTLIQGLLVLVAGAAVAFALIGVFLEILDGVVDNDDIAIIDQPVIEWVADRRTSGLNPLVLAITDIGGKILLVAALAAATSAVALRLRSWRPFVLAAVAGGGGVVLVVGIKALIGRDRPEPLYRAVVESGFSFPSGHTTNALIILGTVAWLISMVTADRTLRATAWVAAGILAVAVGLSRVYLGVHYPSDVLAGWVLGAAWLITVAIAARLPETAAPSIASDLRFSGRQAMQKILRPVAIFTIAAMTGLAAIFGAVSISVVT